ncbi:class F sortase [Saccharopolyspora rosea]|uniref:Class F sortase n=1 Tax=Saccharopolyspora rosea TaxID=524884 RepID=A0ABW3FLM6_9PSEU|nr:class F sortase [Saccharopolyspora rosea]
MRARLIGLAATVLVALVAVVVAVSLLGSGPERRPEAAGQAPAAAPREGGAPQAPPEQAQAAAPPAPPAPRPAGQPPGTIRLPQGGTADLVRREIDRSGTLPIPSGVHEATWWGAGLDAPRGATVLAGHVNWKGSVGPFAELWQSRAGQLVTVVDDHGREWRYRVSDVVTVHKDELPARAADLFGQGGEHRLVLVTCGGRYVGGGLGYDENRIVVATPA